jgi:hypothetical protein
MPATYLNDAGTWRQLRGVYVNDAGTWRTIRGIFVNDSGTWRQVYAAVNLSNTTISFSNVTPGDAIAGFRMRGTTLGTVMGVRGSTIAGASLTDGQVWVDPASNAANYDIMVTQLTGTVLTDTGTGPASLSTWINMNRAVTGTFYAQRTISTPGVTQATCRVDIRPAGGGDTVASAVFTLNAEVEGAP